MRSWPLNFRRSQGERAIRIVGKKRLRECYLCLSVRHIERGNAQLGLHLLRRFKRTTCGEMNFSFATQFRCFRRSEVCNNKRNGKCADIESCGRVMISSKSDVGFG